MCMKHYKPDAPAWTLSFQAGLRAVPSRSVELEQRSPVM